MKKILSLIALTLVLAFTLALVGCGDKIDQKAADKINDAAQNGEPMTLYELRDKYGEPAIEIQVNGTGYVVWLSCGNTEQLKIATENNEKVSALTVTFSNYNATKATFTDNYNNVSEE